MQAIRAISAAPSLRVPGALHSARAVHMLARRSALSSQRSHPRQVVGLSSTEPAYTDKAGRREKEQEVASTNVWLDALYYLGGVNLLGVVYLHCVAPHFSHLVPTATIFEWASALACFVVVMIKFSQTIIKAIKRIIRFPQEVADAVQASERVARRNVELQEARNELKRLRSKWEQAVAAEAEQNAARELEEQTAIQHRKEAVELLKAQVAQHAETRRLRRQKLIEQLRGQAPPSSLGQP